MNRSIPATLLCILAAPALAGDIVWQNMETYPDSMIETTDGWTAVRAEDPGFKSYRVAADDIDFAAQTRITKIIIYNVPQSAIVLGGDYYIYDGEGDQPGILITHEAGLKVDMVDTGFVNKSFGPIYATSMTPTDLVLGPGRYYIALRTLCTFEGGGGKNGMLTTRWPGSESKTNAFWNFQCFEDGSIHDTWVTMDVFGGEPVRESEWAFTLEGEAVGGECRADCNGDGKLNINDFICFQSEWRRQTAYGDYNGDGKWNVNDFIAFQADFVKGCA